MSRIGARPRHLRGLFRSMVFPIVLGAGRQPFAGVSGPPVLEHVRAKRLASGPVILTYRPA